MAEVDVTLSKLVSLLNEMQDKVKAKPWKTMNRQGFVYALSTIISEIEEITHLIEAIAGEYEGEGLSDAPETKEMLKGCAELLLILKRNKEMEEGKGPTMEGIYALRKLPAEKEMYDSLEQRVLSLVLRARYFADRIVVHEKKRNLRPMEGRSAKRNVLDLLEHKENELASLKKKYEELRSKTHAGLVEEETIADIEKEYSELVRRQDVQLKLAMSQLGAFEKEVEAFHAKYRAMKELLSGLEETSASQIEKASELLMHMKKEKDYARKLVLEIENETVRLRSAYSKEILSMEEEKEMARHEAYGKFKQEIFLAKKNADGKDAAINDLRKIVEAREERIRYLSKKTGDLEREKTGLENALAKKEPVTRRKEKGKQANQTRQKAAGKAL